ncbi:hypothetical protein Vadar_031474 [Vaccinium darrowii]|uniref:Uncharacterized protein n=1 Tax=Vaccinium darrowii TaxID=229202 RepID=A0ACB7Y3C8_9ERIC|nr:hypothetical protein Vadar_031474 [Vaccinium darrowii]
MKLLQSLSGHRRSLVRVIGRRYFAASTEEYAKRNYANNDAEYNTVITSLTSQRRHFLLRDVYDDMMLDGVKPARDTFHSLIVGTMKGARLQDAFFFRDEMKAMGLVPDVALYNFLISTCGKCENSQQAIQILEEMKRYEVKPTGQTFICLLSACAAAGRLDRVYAIVRDMTAAGLGLNKFCYAGLIAAHMNKTPITDDTASKIIELVEQSKGWSSVESTRDNAENVMMDLRNVEAMERLLDMLRKDGNTPDVYILIQIMRCYLHSGDLDRGQKVFEDYMNAGKPPMAELYATLVEGAMVGYTPRGMQLALETLEKMTARGIRLNPKMVNDLLLAASGERTGGYTMANYLWDLMQSRNMNPWPPAVEAYYRGLKERDIPADDQRLILVSRTYENQRLRFGQGTEARPRRRFILNLASQRDDRLRDLKPLSPLKTHLPRRSAAFRFPRRRPLLSLSLCLCLSLFSPSYLTTTEWRSSNKSQIIKLFHKRTRNPRMKGEKLG